MSRTAKTKKEITSQSSLPFDGDVKKATYGQHLVFDQLTRPENATSRQQFAAISQSLRDLMTEQWLKTQETYDRENPKRIYYLSMEFLIGRTLVNNVINLKAEQFIREQLGSFPNQCWTEIVEAEPDAGLGNGGLGRLAACFIESLATLQLPAMGYGLRYDYGIFKQTIENGSQIEQPDHWLAEPDPWEVARPLESVEISVGCTIQLENGVLRGVPGKTSKLIGIPYDRPVVGYGSQTVNTLRLWRAASPDFFDFGEFNTGDFVGAVVERVVAETITRVLYPDDSTMAGQVLRFLQQYFLVSCSLADLIARFRRSNSDWASLPDKVAIQLNDTHPTMSVPVLMRILLDEAGLDWDTAWDLTRRTLAYTNHTLLPEALEKWPVRFFELTCPRLLSIIYEINDRLLQEVRTRFPDDQERVLRVSLIEEMPERHVRMANLAIAGTHSTNGVAQIHSDLLRTRVVSDFAELYPDRFNNKTNGVTPRRWLLSANPALASLITDAIGSNWITDLTELKKLRPLANDAQFQTRFLQTKREAKQLLADWLKSTTGKLIDPDSIFDSQIKRIHEYKRQLLNVLHIIVLYNRLRSNPSLRIPPRTFFFAGKAAPAYRLAKLIIRFIESVAKTIDADPLVRETINVVFLPNYNVSLAERLIPASDVSEQISTAGFEASGTGNMKFMMNGALTIGTRDGATIEMAQEAGEDNFFLFGLTAEQVANSRSWYNPRWHYGHESETRAALDLIINNHFSPNEPGLFTPIIETLLDRGDYFMHLADLTSYAEAQQRVGERYADSAAWARQAIFNIAGSGKFSSDRTIAEYAAEIWNATPCPVE